ncbi:hypothetical protein ACFV8T_39285 [Streptomyces sp. NPDC059832]|uniref:hypothetical protein n=1 Tax=Streptomyces sp. NPDC059832 TaxID=3346966 RepID=UPI00364CCFE3
MKHNTAALAAAFAAATGLTYPIAAELAQSDLSPMVAVACTATTGSVFLTLGTGLVTRLATRSFRCPDCTFAVRVRHTGAGETRRWQEIAADHPHHVGAVRS